MISEVYHVINMGSDGARRLFQEGPDCDTNFFKEFIPPVIS